MVTEQTQPKATSGDWWFRGAATLTVAWIAFLGVLSVFRQPDYWPLFEPKASDANSTHLSLNEIGDFLSGSFAPLAFLWFFVSTWLQREELKETRQVLVEQQRELRNAARESAEQTAIMQRQLEVARSRDVYEEHQLRLYYLAQFIITANHLRFIYRENGQDKSRAILGNDPPDRFVQSTESVDRVMNKFHRTVKAINALSEGTPLHIDPKLREALDYIDLILKQLLFDTSYLNNILISARMHGTNMFKVYRDLQELLATSARLAPR